MARGKYRSSAEIEAQIQALLEKKKALERESISKITDEIVQRIKEICSNKAVDLSDGEVNYIVEPCRNFERNIFKKNKANEKKDKETIPWRAA